MFETFSDLEIQFCAWYPTFTKYSILDCSSIAGVYNDGSINVSYQKGNLYVHYKSSSVKNIIGEIKPSCEGYITFGNNEQETFVFNKEDKEIVWYDGHARDKWIRG